MEVNRCEVLAVMKNRVEYTGAGVGVEVDVVAVIVNRLGPHLK